MASTGSQNVPVMVMVTSSVIIAEAMEKYHCNRQNEFNVNGSGFCFKFRFFFFCGLNQQYVTIGYGDCLALNRHEASVWTNYVSVHWCNTRTQVEFLKFGDVGRFGHAPWYNTGNTFLHFYTPHTTKLLGGILVSLRQSIHLSIWLDPFHIHASYQVTSEGVSCVKFFQRLSVSRIFGYAHDIKAIVPMLFGGLRSLSSPVLMSPWQP